MRALPTQWTVWHQRLRGENRCPQSRGGQGVLCTSPAPCTRDRELALSPSIVAQNVGSSVHLLGVVGTSQHFPAHPEVPQQQIPGWARWASLPWARLCPLGWTGLARVALVVLVRVDMVPHLSLGDLGPLHIGLQSLWSPGVSA